MDWEAFERDGALHAGRRLDDRALDALRELADALAVCFRSTMRTSTCPAG